jgi:hypothetical protein
MSRISKYTIWLNHLLTECGGLEITLAGMLGRGTRRSTDIRIKSIASANTILEDEQIMFLR